MPKKDAFYFPHDYNAANDVKCLFLRQQLGMEGYGIFWFLVEQLANSGGKLPLQIIPVLAMQMQVPEVKVTAVIKQFGLFEVEENEIFFSNRLNAHLFEREQIRLRNSDKGKKSGEKRAAMVQQRLNNGSTADEQRKGKETKGNEKKVKESKEKETKEKTVNGILEESWINAQRILKDDKPYIEAIAMKHRVEFKQIQVRLNAFLKRLDETLDWKDVPALKRHFSNSLNKHGVAVPDFSSGDVGRKTAIVEPPMTMTKEEMMYGWDEPPKDEYDYSNISWD
jgi:hypothetical protein